MSGFRLRPAAIIGRREYLIRIRSKGFWIGTVALPVLMAAWAILPAILLTATSSSHELAVVDETGEVAELLIERLDLLAERTADQLSFAVEIVQPTGDPVSLREELDRRVLDDEIAAWIWIDDEALEASEVEYHAESVSNFLTQQTLEAALSATMRQVRLEEAGFDAGIVADLSRNVGLNTIRVSESGSREEGGLGGFILAFGIFMVLYTSTLIYGQQVLQGVLEEKTTRIVEIIVAAVRPLELMAGKILGICAVGLTQLGIWIAVAVGLTAPGVVAMMTWLPEGIEVPTLSPVLILHFFLLFLLGYLFYATFYAMIGSAFNNMQEAQQVAGIAILFVVAPWFFFWPILNDPDSTVAVVTSLIPIFTPFLMMLRIAIKMPPTWQILLGYALTIGLCVAMTWLSARVYRVGILMYGKKPRLSEIWRWIRYA